jgi:hypothetical protein
MRLTTLTTTIIVLVSTFSGGVTDAFAPAPLLSGTKHKKTQQLSQLPAKLQKSPAISSLSSSARTKREYDLKFLGPAKSQWTVSLFLPLALACSVALAPPAYALDPGTFTNDYADPLHPECKRHIQVNADGKTFHFSGTSVDQPKDDPVLRGCSREEVKQFGLRKGSFDGTIFDDNKISAGDGIHEGAWEPAGSASTNLGYEDVDGIRWNDGNKWVVQRKSLATKVGEFITFSYIGFSLLAGVVGVNKMYQKKKSEG